MEELTFRLDPELGWIGVQANINYTPYILKFTANPPPNINKWVKLTEEQIQEQRTNLDSLAEGMRDGAQEGYDEFFIQGYDEDFFNVVLQSCDKILYGASTIDIEGAESIWAELTEYGAEFVELLL